MTDTTAAPSAQFLDLNDCDSVYDSDSSISDIDDAADEPVAFDSPEVRRSAAATPASAAVSIATDISSSLNSIEKVDDNQFQAELLLDFFSAVTVAQPVVPATTQATAAAAVMAVTRDAAPSTPTEDEETLSFRRRRVQRHYSPQTCLGGPTSPNEPAWNLPASYEQLFLTSAASASAPAVPQPEAFVEVEPKKSPSLVIKIRLDAKKLKPSPEFIKAEAEQPQPQQLQEEEHSEDSDADSNGSSSSEEDASWSKSKGTSKKRKRKVSSERCKKLYRMAKHTCDKKRKTAPLVGVEIFVQDQVQIPADLSQTLELRRYLLIVAGTSAQNDISLASFQENVWALSVLRHWRQWAFGFPANSAAVAAEQPSLTISAMQDVYRKRRLADRIVNHEIDDEIDEHWYDLKTALGKDGVKDDTVTGDVEKLFKLGAFLELLHTRLICQISKDSSAKWDGWLKFFLVGRLSNIADMSSLLDINGRPASKLRYDGINLLSSYITSEYKAMRGLSSSGAKKSDVPAPAPAAVKTEIKKTAR